MTGSRERKPPGGGDQRAAKAEQSIVSTAEPSRPERRRQALAELAAELKERVADAEGHVAAAERDGDAPAARLCREDLEVAQAQLEAVRVLLGEPAA